MKNGFKIQNKNPIVTQIDKKFYNKDDMERIKVVKAETGAIYRKNSFIYDFMSSMRQKINDPLGQRAKKRSQSNQR